ncbi:MAG TPA: hypothetical protein VI454_02255, partial [Verrucomicrobiae bacterium]
MLGNHGAQNLHCAWDGSTGHVGRRVSSPPLERKAMTPNHLRSFFDQCTPTQLSLWVKKQTLLARAYRNFLIKRFGRQDLSNSTPIGLPDEDAIVNAAIERV